ncbi:glycosyltransferase family 2 protein [Clostridium aestuarii]|uniref:Glycosyltransferase family 2 protein n=1 Tax=Clostridium aestuarii TaxID=338193 RepID=A0ABT4CZW1_9CLOT|nr:glycosyltransferase family 2 protein [Clostridium aestuarii]MCY6484519.1 glycosyltransferase family 2 protein [Clostridium aestuarii]
MKVSIVIPNYNGAKYIKGCIASLKKQTYDNYELIIVDNASQDNSIEIIEKYHPQVNLIKNKQNYGFSITVNQGIKAACGKYVVLLNNDTEVFEDWLKNLVECIEQDKKIFSVCSKMLRYNEKDKIDDAGDEYCILGWAYKCGDGTSINRYNKDREVFSSCGGAAIYRKSVFEQIGYFDESFFAYLEDVDISYRAKIYGYKNIYCSGAKVYHIGSATSGSRHNAFKVKLAARNNLYVIFKNMPLFQRIINLPFLFIGHVIKYLYFIKKGLGNEYKQGIKEALINRKNISKVKFEIKNLINYVKIELNLILNLFKMIKY